MSSKAPQLPPKNAQRPRMVKSTTPNRIEALQQMVRQEKANALFWHDKYAATLPTTECRGTPPPPPPMKVGDRGDTIGTDGVRRTRAGRIVTGHTPAIAFAVVGWLAFLGGVLCAVWFK